MKLLILGDLYYNYPSVRDEVRELGACFREKGFLTIPNLEGGTGYPDGKGIRKRGKCLKQEKCITEVLKELSVTGVTLANNHVMDFGAKGLFSTLEMLDNEGISHTGAGRDLKEALKPMEFTFGGKTTAVFNFGWKAEETVYAGSNSPGCAPRENGIVLDSVRSYAEENPGTAIIPVLHWGFEKNLYPMPFDIDLAHRLTEIKEVKTVIGHHPHCPQPVEEHRGKKIYYSLGNFFFGKGRVRYAEKRYPHEPEDMSDYGIGVIYDTETEDTEDIVLYYDKAIDKTVIRDDPRIPEKMPDTSDTEAYTALIKSHRLGKAPVLKGTGLADTLKVFLYNSRRNINRFIP